MCEALASLVLPAPCRICARILDTGSRIPFCQACMAALLKTLPEPLCAQCARPLARLLGIPFRSYLLVRTRPRPDQLRLTRRERWETVRGAYATHSAAKVDKLRVLLVDDVFTTGATLDACSRALKGAGAGRVAGMTVARALPSFVEPEAATANQVQAE